MYLLNFDSRYGLECRMWESFSSLMVQWQHRQMLWSVGFNITFQCHIDRSVIVLPGQRVQLGYTRSATNQHPIVESIHLLIFGFYSIFKSYHQMLFHRKPVLGGLHGQLCHNIQLALPHVVHHHPEAKGFQKSAWATLLTSCVDANRHSLCISIEDRLPQLQQQNNTKSRVLAGHLLRVSSVLLLAHFDSIWHG